MKHLPALLALGAISFLTATGCNQGAPADPAQAFQAASAEIQTHWRHAMDAASTNNYATAVLTLRKLQMDSRLTPDQLAAVNSQMTVVNQKLAIAEQKGDPDAKQAMEEIRQRWRSP